MPNLDRFDILSISIFCKTPLSIVSQTGVNKKPLVCPFQDRQTYKQFQKFLLVRDSFGPNRCKKICVEAILRFSTLPPGQVVLKFELPKTQVGQ